MRERRRQHPWSREGWGALLGVVIGWALVFGAAMVILHFVRNFQVKP